VIRYRRGRSDVGRALALALLTLGPPVSSPAEEPEPPQHVTPPVRVETIETAELPQDPTAFTTTVDPEDFRGEAKTADELIGDTVGVQVRRFGGRGDPSEISIRGSTANQVVVLLDGVRLNTAQTGSVDLSTIPPDLIERIEISRGGGSVQLGSDAIGGVVNVITRRPTSQAATHAAFEAGSFGSFAGSLSQTGQWRGTEFSLGYDGFGTDGDWKFQTTEFESDGQRIGESATATRVNNDEQSHSGLVRVARDLGDHARLRFSDSFLWREGGEPGPDAFGVAGAGQSVTARRKRLRNVADLFLEVAEVSPWKLNGDVRLYHRYDRNRFRETDPFFGQPFDTDPRNHSLGLRSDVRRRLAWGPTRHDLSLGLDLREDWLRARDFDDPERGTVGVFVQDEIWLLEDRLRLAPALRFDKTEGFAGEWIPRFGFIARALPWLRFRANVERSYRVPNFDELFLDEAFVRGNPNLAPEDATNADLGFDLRFKRIGPVREIWLEAAGFYNDIDESIVFQTQSAALVIATNTGPAHIVGLELAGGFGLLGWLHFSGNWTHLDSEIESTGASLPGRADDEWLLRLVLGPESGLFKLVGERRQTGDIPTDFGGTALVRGRTVWDASAALDLAQLPWLGRYIPGSSLLLSVTGRNLGDVSVRDAAFFPQPGRSLAFRIEWRRS
jgi:vitamin B12 transporter